jgi:hypothetical protein
MIVTVDAMPASKRSPLADRTLRCSLGGSIPSIGTAAPIAAGLPVTRCRTRSGNKLTTLPHPGLGAARRPRVKNNVATEVRVFRTPRSAERRDTPNRVDSRTTRTPVIEMREPEVALYRER